MPENYTGKTVAVDGGDGERFTATVDEDTGGAMVKTRVLNPGTSAYTTCERVDVFCDEIVGIVVDGELVQS